MLKSKTYKKMSADVKETTDSADLMHQGRLFHILGATT